MMAHHKSYILIIDDDLRVVTLLSQMLESLDYHVETAMTSEEGIIAARATLPELILLDVQLPKMTGYIVCEYLKADPVTAHIPIIFVSGLDDSFNIMKAFEVGGADYIVKPLRLQELMVRVENQLTIYRQRRELEVRRERDRQHFETLHYMREQFINSATHDLRSPMSLVIGYVALLEKLNIPEHQTLISKVAEGIRSGVNRMQELITDMLELAEIESGGKLNLRPTRLRPFLSNQAEGFEVRASQEQMTFIFEPPQDDVEVMLDTHYMTRVLENLVSNAIKYSPNGGVVTLKAWLDQDHAKLQISDQGLGIPADSLPFLFEAFYRVKEDSHYEIQGTGLGLSIVKTIVDQHHGQIGVDSILGKGSTFTITLPMNSIR